MSEKPTLSALVENANMIELPSGDIPYFVVETPLGFRVRTTVDYWDLITTIKHPAIRGREDDIKATLMHPDEIRVSKNDPQVFLFYRRKTTQSRRIPDHSIPY